MNLSYGLLAGTDLPDGSTSEVKTNWTPDSGLGYYAQAARQAAMRIMYVVVNSNAMNFIGEDTLIVSYDPVWFAVRDALVITAIVLFVISVAAVVATTVWNEICDRRGKRKGE